MPELIDRRIRWADFVRLERHRRRMQQAEVAERAGLDQTTVSKAEAGRARDETYKAIADALGIALPEAS